jgi:nucleotide-binding universal stress UspA family protein
MIKDIVVNLPIDAKRDVVTGYAIEAARKFDAHLTGIAFVQQPYVPGSLLEGAVSEIVRAQRAEFEKAARNAVAAFEAKARGLQTSSRLVELGAVTTYESFGPIARRFDLAILAQPEPEDPEPARTILEAALFDSGRPVLVVPYIQQSASFGRVMVCWDGSRSAARAIGDALPFMKAAKAVDIVTIAGEPAKSNELPGVDIAQHLARHGLKVEFERQVVRDIDVTSTILSRAADKGTDLIVMGGYGHSRLREFVLGGATRGIIASMTVPVLMSH